MSINLTHDNQTKNLLINNNNTNSNFDNINILKSFDDTEREQHEKLDLNFLSPEDNLSDNNSNPNISMSAHHSIADSNKNIYQDDNFNFNNQNNDFTPDNYNPEFINKEKAKYINKLNRLKLKGFILSCDYNMNYNLDDIKGEYFRLIEEIKIDNTLTQCQNGIVGAIGLIETLNGVYNPFNLQLNGISGHMLNEVKTPHYELVLEALIEKYYSKVEVAPEFQLIGMIVFSCITFHFSKQFSDSMMNGGADGNFLGNIMNMFSKAQNSKTQPPAKPTEPKKQPFFSGPKETPEELLKKINNNNLSDDNLSDISDLSDFNMDLESVSDKPIVFNEPKKTPKTRGRPKKIKK